MPKWSMPPLGCTEWLLASLRTHCPKLQQLLRCRKSSWLARRAEKACERFGPCNRLGASDGPMRSRLTSADFWHPTASVETVYYNTAHLGTRHLRVAPGSRG